MSPRGRRRTTHRRAPIRRTPWPFEGDVACGIACADHGPESPATPSRASSAGRTRARAHERIEKRGGGETEVEAGRTHEVRPPPDRRRGDDDGGAPLTRLGYLVGSAKEVHGSHLRLERLHPAPA